jgi:glycosyltransferase involved in cell wall biosynthesis
MRKRPTVSVVVPTKDVQRTLRRCLASIRSQTYSAIELVVVDNFSADGTFEVAQELADVAVQAGPERSAQRNLGIQLASGEYILWIDADMVLTPHVVADAVAAAELEGATAVFIPEQTVGSGFWTACRALERRCYVGVELIEAPRLIRRQWFLDQGGFVDDVAGQEDADIRMRLLREGRRMPHIDTVILHDEGRLTLRFIVQKRYYYGKSLPAYNRAQPGAIAAQGRATALAMVAGVPILVQQPVHAIALLGLRGVEGAAYAAGAARASWVARRR